MFFIAYISYFKKQEEPFIDYIAEYKVHNFLWCFLLSDNGLAKNKVLTGFFFINLYINYWNGRYSKLCMMHW